MFGIKTALFKYFSTINLRLIDKISFPTAPLSPMSKKGLGIFLQNKLKREADYQDFSSPTTATVNHEIYAFYKNISRFNPNNLGNWSTTNNPHSLSTKLERKNIFQIIDLIKGDPKKLEGYISSGATEGNILACWSGREFLKEKTNKRVLLLTDLTHYSIKKAANITAIDTKNIKLNSKTWSMDVNDLEKVVRNYYSRGTKGFLIPLTLGYTLTGTSDPYKEIHKLIDRLKKELDIYFFTWIDGAFLGLIFPFTQKSFKPLESKYTKLFITDYHKTATLPYSSGAIIYKKSIKKYIESTKIDYINQSDSTVLGSRSGINSILIWYLNQVLGKRGFKKQIKNNINQKNSFLNTIKNNFSDIEIITSPDSTQACLIVNNKKDIAKLKRKYNLQTHRVKLEFTDKIRKANICKLFFLESTKDKKRS